MIPSKWYDQSQLMYRLSNLRQACFEVFEKPLSNEAKIAACLAILREYMGKLAMRRVGQANAPLRFYADMRILRKQLRMTPSDPVEFEFDKLLLWPCLYYLDRWLVEHGHPENHNNGEDLAIFLIQWQHLAGRA